MNFKRSAPQASRQWNKVESGEWRGLRTPLYSELCTLNSVP